MWEKKKFDYEDDMIKFLNTNNIKQFSFTYVPSKHVLVSPYWMLIYLNDVFQ